MVEPNADLIFGAVVDSSLDQDVSITLIATGFGVGAFSESASAPFLDQRMPAVQQSQSVTERWEFQYTTTSYKPLSILLSLIRIF